LDHQPSSNFFQQHNQIVSTKFSLAIQGPALQLRIGLALSTEKSSAEVWGKVAKLMSN
jgi:hypothetical protein